MLMNNNLTTRPSNGLDSDKTPEHTLSGFEYAGDRRSGRLLERAYVALWALRFYVVDRWRGKKMSYRDIYPLW